MSNTFGTLFSLTTFGESHGKAMGGIVSGCPAGIKVDLEKIRTKIAHRRPGQSNITTQRQETDEVTFLSGLLNGVTTGAPIGFIIPNRDCRPSDYDELKRAFRPNHADYTYHIKYQGHNDPYGGGRSSARETVSRVVGGAVASQILAELCPTLRIDAYTSTIGNIKLDTDKHIEFDDIYSNAVRCPDTKTAEAMQALIEKVRKEGDSIGGQVKCIIRNCPVGIGEPVFDKLNARLAGAMMSINAAKAVEIGEGVKFAAKRGSEVLDTWAKAADDGRGIRALNNHSGGIQGGLSNGEDIEITVTFKPTPTLGQAIETVNADLEPIVLQARGRHDPCVVPRAVPVVEAMAAMTLLDLILIDRAHKL